MKTYYRKVMRDFIIKTIDVCVILVNSRVVSKITASGSYDGYLDTATCKCLSNCFRNFLYSSLESGEE